MPPRDASAITPRAAATQSPRSLIRRFHEFGCRPRGAEDVIWAISKDLSFGGIAIGTTGVLVC